MPQKNRGNDSDKIAEKAEEIYFRLVGSMRGRYPINTINLYIIFACYIMYKYKKSDYKGLLLYDLIFTTDLGIDPSVLMAIYNSYNKDVFEQSMMPLTTCNDDRVFVEIIEKYAIKGYGQVYRSAGDYSTPEPVVLLAERLLKIQKEENVADVCSGNGDFLCHALRKHPFAHYSGYEINMLSVAISKIRADIIGHKLRIEPGDALLNLGQTSAQYDKIFCNYPFSMRTFGDMQIGNKYNHLAKNNRCDWLFNTLVCEHLAENGKAVTVSTIGSLWNMLDREARKYFIDNGLIESIIFLPAGVYRPYTEIETAIIVFSKNNSSVRFVNASNYRGLINEREENDEHRRLMNYEIDKIIALLHEDVDGISFSVDNDAIRDANYDLSIKPYYSDLPKYENGVKISEVADILRGIIINSRMISEDSGNDCVVRLSDIQGAIVPEKLSFAKDGVIEKGLTLEDGDIIISRTLNPIKVAIFTGNKNKVYPCGNLFVVRLRNTDTLDPYYLLSFLLSEEGQKALEFAATGTTLKVIGANSLGNTVFPMVGMKRQKEISEKIKAALMEVNTYEYKLMKAKDKIRGAFYEGGEG